jgi:hypothetical protein
LKEYNLKRLGMEEEIKRRLEKVGEEIFREENETESLKKMMEVIVDLQKNVGKRTIEVEGIVENRRMGIILRGDVFLVWEEDGNHYHKEGYRYPRLILFFDRKSLRKLVALFTEPETEVRVRT